jgi:hypothetical protein
MRIGFILPCYNEYENILICSACSSSFLFKLFNSDISYIRRFPEKNNLK